MSLSSTKKIGLVNVNSGTHIEFCKVFLNRTNRRTVLQALSPYRPSVLQLFKIILGIIKPFLAASVDILISLS